MTIDSRFWDKVVKTESCWLWTACRVNGYGLFWDGRKNIRAHRYLFERFYGPVPIGMLLDHKCHNPSCVNPYHLRLASNTENQYNAIRRVDNASGFKGVYWLGKIKKWRALIRFGGKRHSLGYFLTSPEAHAAYCAAAKRLHGEFANFGG